MIFSPMGAFKQVGFFSKFNLKQTFLSSLKCTREKNIHFVFCVTSRYFMKMSRYFTKLPRYFAKCTCTYISLVRQNISLVAKVEAMPFAKYHTFVKK